MNDVKYGDDRFKISHTFRICDAGGLGINVCRIASVTQGKANVSSRNEEIQVVSTGKRCASLDEDSLAHLTS